MNVTMGRKTDRATVALTHSHRTTENICVDFINQTNFSTLLFEGLDLHDAGFRTAVLKVGYRLSRCAAPGRVVAELAEEPVPLCLTDEYYGEINRSAVREECDLAHYKPRCDVIVRGSAHAPGARPAPQWDVGIRVVAPTPSWEAALTAGNIMSMLRLRPALQARQPERWPHPAAPTPSPADSTGCHTVLLDKKLRVTGQRDMIRHRNEWRLGTPQPATQVPMRWENAFGGESVVRNPRYERDSDTPEFLLNEVCFSNPLGRGWSEKRFPDALSEAGQEQPERLAAPQIEAIERPFSRHVVSRHPDRMKGTDPDEFIRAVKGYEFHPENLGIVGRPWVPRLQLAGTYDQQWIDERWPRLPRDFDFGYWNCAPRDQQIDALPSDSRIELWNLADPALTLNGYLAIDLPDDKPHLYVYLSNGLCLPLPMMTDTLIVDTDRMTLTLTHRIAFLETPDIERVEVWLEPYLPR